MRGETFDAGLRAAEKGEGLFDDENEIADEVTVIDVGDVRGIVFVGAFDIL